MAYKIFENGLPLNASELNTYLMKQVVAVFADATARTAAITSPVEGQMTYLESTDQFNYWTGSAWANIIPTAATPTVSDKSANYTIVAGDVNNTIRSTGSAITITVANVLTVGQRIDFSQYGTGQITFAAGAGVTLNSKDSKLKTHSQYTAASVLCVASGVYQLIGDLAA
jgi:hypothetical protein